MKIHLLFLSIAAILLFSSCDQNKEELIIFHAGSLSIPFQELADTLEQRHPQIAVKREAAGSMACARKITELNRKADLMASSDIDIIHKMLIPKYTDSAIAFAGNEMVIAYHENSPGRDTINKENWPEILLHDDISFGRSNPDLDPCGYRSILAMKLQEKYLSTKKFVNKLRAKDQRFIRPKETDLLALLETGSIDYMFIYKSVARQHTLSYLSLNDTVNLSKNHLESLYNTVSVKVKGKKPEDSLQIKGNPMTYGICTLKNAPNPKAAHKFLKLLQSKTGREIIIRNGQNSLIKL